MSTKLLQQDPAPIDVPRAAKWPGKCDLFGVHVSATDYEEAVDALALAARSGLSSVASFHSVHALIEASRDPELRRRVNSFDLIGPDGQPVRWALNLLHKTRLLDRVYGPEIMRRLIARASHDGIPVYFLGGTPEVVEELKRKFMSVHPALRVAGAESPPFQPLTEEEDEALIRRINESGARLVFVGLGAPKQDHFAFEHRDRISAVQVCVGAAFDFHAENKKMAPAWMQKHGLEWLYRLCQEPGRLWKRYLVTNSLFVVMFSAFLLKRFLSRKKLETGE